MAFESQLYFHALALISREVERKELKIFRYVIDSTMVRMTVSLVRKAGDALTSSSLA